MLFEKFSREIFHAFNPKKFHELAEKPFWDSVKFMTKILVIAYIIMAILMIPKLVNLKDNIHSELSKFDTFSLKGEVTQSSQIKIPEKEPLIIIDASGDEIIPGKEKITVTRNSLFYKFFTRKEVPLNQIKEMSQNKSVVSKLFLYIMAFIFPSIVFFSFAGIWIKYFLFAIFIGTLVFLMADLTRFSQSWKTCFKSVFYASPIIILVEAVSSALYPGWMIALFSFWGLHLYLIPLVAWLVLSLIFVSCLHFYKLKKQKH